jgi:D-alanyl-D-alanine carboxypeptidase
MEPASRLVALAVGSALAAALLTAPMGEGAPPTRVAKLDGILKSLVSASNSPGAVLLVQTPTGTWQKAAGLASIKPRQAMKTTGRFRVASVTKVFTAAVVLRLVEAGTLSLEDTVERWLPGRVPGGAGSAITIRMLLSHTSGLADLQYGGDPFGVDGPPGPFRYANWNYNLLGEIVAAATSSTFDAELARLILRPLQLTSTELLVPTETPTNVVRGYSPGKPRYDFTAVWRDPGPAAALIATATDLARFERALFTGKVVSSTLVREMQTPGSVRGFVTVGYDAYGLGLMRYPSRCGSAWGHRGRIPGYTSFLLSTADGKRTVVLLLNAGEVPNAALLQGGVNRLVTTALCT